MDYLKKFHNEDWHTPKGRVIREVIFGMNDGIVTIVCFVAGITVSIEDIRVILLSGLAEIVAGAISMFFGAYLSIKSQREFFDNEIKREKREIDEMPEKETEEIREIYTNLGFKDNEVDMIVKRVTSDKKLWVRFMLREELGILEENFDDPVKVGAIMGSSFMIGSLPPLIPYLLMDNPVTALKLAILVSIVILFGIGAGKTAITKGNWIKSGIEVSIIGTAASGIGYGIGKIVSLVV
ncbi:MAG: VIT1/CCC1 transporter family protein [Nitrospinae bacterium]|nr:VIT1/CCC1 transporter family protein [Nitrospinota bacterium]